MARLGRAQPFPPVLAKQPVAAAPVQTANINQATIIG